MNSVYTRIIIALAVIIVALGFARSSTAQGTFGSLPDPISSRDLDQYAERLALSDQQLLAIAEHHGRYLEDFRELRDRDIQRLLDDVQVLTRDFDFSQRRQVEQAVRTLNRIMQQIRTLDERLFDEMQNVLTDEQAAKLPRVRLQRERLRYSGEMTRGVDFLNPAVRVDLSAILQNMDLAPDVMELTDPILEVYERRLTMAARKLFDTTTTMILDALKQLEEMGFTQGSPQDPRMALRLFEAFQQIWGDLSADLLKEAGEISALQLSTYRSLASVLPIEVQRDLRSRYYGRAYPEAASVGRRAERQFAAALRLEELSQRQIDDIEAMAESHWQAQDRIANQIVGLLDARRRDFSIREIMRRNEDERQQQIDDLRTKADSNDDAVLSTLHAMLGEELAERVRSGRVPGAGAGNRRTQAASRARGPEPQAGDPFVGRLPGRISTADVNRYAAQLDFDEGQRVVLESMHEDYLTRFNQLSEEHFTPLRAAAREMAAMSMNFGNTQPDEARRASEIFVLQRSAFDSLRELDERFFDDVKAIIQPNQSRALERLRLERERLAYTGGTNQPRRNLWDSQQRGGGGWGNQSNESSIDLSLLVNELQIQASLGERADETLLDYERRATELFREKYNAELDVYQALRTINVQEDRRAFRDVMARSGRISSEMNRALIVLNREALNDMQTAMPSDSAHYLQHYYRRYAFPEVFNDAAHAEEKIAAALNMTELSESQRDRLRELSLEYRGNYARIADRMFQVHEAAVQLEGDASNRANREDRMLTRNELDRLRFERDELNESARRQLRAILSQDQLQRIGGM